MQTRGPLGRRVARAQRVDADVRASFGDIHARPDVLLEKGALVLPHDAQPVKREIEEPVERARAVVRAPDADGAVPDGKAVEACGEHRRLGVCLRKGSVKK